METSYVIDNARIASTFLGIQDHGIMTFLLPIDDGCCSQGYGGFGLDKGRLDIMGEGIGINAIRAILECLGVKKWEDLPGTLIRVRRSSRSSDRIDGIGHIIENKWVNLAMIFNAPKEKP